MPGNEELMMRLAQLEQSYFGDKEAERQKKFMDTYGSRWSNNHGIGMAVLNELDARGIDTSAADEAVQEILDTLRTDCQNIIDAIAVMQDEIIQEAKKVETVANAVSNAVANNPNASMPDEMPAMVEPNEVPPEVDALDPNSLAQEPTEEDMAALGVDGSEELEPEQEQAAEPEPEPEQEPAQAPAQEPVKENPVNRPISDERMKRIEKMKSRWGRTSTQKKEDKKKEDKEDKKDTVVSDRNLKNIFRPSASLIAAASRGY